jgi:hypothetical protein
VFNLFNHAQCVGGFISDVAPAGTALPGTNNSTTSSAVHNFLIPTSSIFGDPTQAFSSNPRMMQLSRSSRFSEPPANCAGVGITADGAG